MPNQFAGRRGSGTSGVTNYPSAYRGQGAAPSLFGAAWRRAEARARRAEDLLAGQRNREQALLAPADKAALAVATSASPEQPPSKVVDHDSLEDFALEWAREINSKSPTAMRMLKYAFNMIVDGLVGQQLFAGEATRLAYGTAEAAEGRDAFLEKRPRDFSPFPWQY